MIEVGDDGELYDADWHHREGARALYEARMRVQFENRGSAEESYRHAIAMLAEAFLLDRTGHDRCFSYAHRAGEEVSELFGCQYEYDESAMEYRLQCPIFALHAYVGTSIAWSFSTSCTICGAGAFECEHIPGDEYDGTICGFQPNGVRTFDHVALTPNPDFSYTWHWPHQRSAAELVQAGTIERPGDIASCDHCESCPGRWGPSPDDLDPVGRWERALRERRQSEP